METDQTQAGVGQHAGSLMRYRNLRLTENEAIGSITLYDAETPATLFITTKRTAEFPIGALFRFMNKWQNYGWSVERHDPLERDRTHIVCRKMKKLYSRSGPQGG